MEIAFSAKNSIKIKTKNTTIAIDPQKETDADIVIQAIGEGGEVGDATKLVIEGPGEYEVGGVHVSADKQDGVSSFKIFDDQNSILLVPSTAVRKVKEGDDYDAVIIMANAPTTSDSISQLSADIIMIYGDEAHIPLQDPTLNRISKVNLKKKEELKGSLVYLSA